MKMTKQFTSWEQLPVILDIPQVACLLCLHPNTVTRLCRTGQLTGRKIGREWRVNKESVMNFMNYKHEKDEEDNELWMYP